MRQTESGLRFNRRFRRIALHTLKYSTLFISGVAAVLTTLVVGITWLNTTYGSFGTFLVIAALVVAGLLVAAGYKFAVDHVGDLERKEEELKRQLQRDASYR